MMHFLARFHPLFLVAFALFGIPFHGAMTQSATTTSNESACSQTVQRQEWCAICLVSQNHLIHINNFAVTTNRRSLSSVQKANYIKAVRCLQGLPPKTAFAGVKSRFDDFQALHINMTNVIHFVVSMEAFKSSSG